MKTTKYWIFTLFLGLTLPVLAQDTLMHIMTVSSGGGLSTSASYSMMNTIAQPLTGIVPSTSYDNGFGFWHAQDAINDYYAAPFSVTSGWNMISVSKQVSDYHKQALFPTAISNAFDYEGSYHIKDSLIVGNGYWLKFASAQTISFPGIPIETDSIKVTSNWNIIGSVNSPIPVSSINQSPNGIVSSQYFGYNGMYYIASTIEPGAAYWVKTKNPGTLILNGSISTPVPAQSGKQVADNNQFSVLSVSPSTTTATNSSQKQELYFGSAEVDSSSLDKFDLPPVPPNGGIDARFLSNKFFQKIPKNVSGPVELPIYLQSDGMPLKLSWNMKSESGIKYTLLEKKGSQILASHKMLQSGSISLNVQEGVQYFLRAESVPEQFALSQNYPNPFNPTTTIRFDIPVSSMVTITVYNVLGQRVAIPVNNQFVEEGHQTATFDARNLASGAYFYRIDAKEIGQEKEFHSVKKMMLLK